MRQQLAPITVSAERWFDHQMREKSNFQNEIVSVIDHTLLYGRGICKAVWDEENKRVSFEAIDPFHLIVPYYTKDLAKADYIVHVLRLSVDAYKANAAYKQDKALIDKISGRSDSAQGISTEVQDEIFRREGITEEHEKDHLS